MADTQTTVQKLGVKDGLKNVYYALLTKDDDSGVTYGTPKKLGHARKATITKETETVTVYGDNVAIATKTRLKSVALSVETTDIPLEDQAILLGHGYDSVTGMMTAKGDDSAPYVAVFFEATKLTGGSAFYKLAKGKFTETNEDLTTQEENMNPTSPSLDGTFIAREYDNVVYTKADSANSISETITSAWYTATGGEPSSN